MMALVLPSWRVLAIAGAALVVVLLVAGGIWLWADAQHQRGLAAYAEALTQVQASQQPQASAEARAAAITALESVLQRYPSASAAPQAAYELGNLKYVAKQYAAARSAYEVVLRHASGPPTLRRLSRVAIAYTWEAERDYARAIQALQEALADLKPGDFLQEDILVDLARVQELAGRRDDAIATYRRVLTNPRGRRVEDVKARLASLGASS